VVGGGVDPGGQTGDNGDPPLDQSPGDVGSDTKTATRRVRDPTTDTPTSSAPMSPFTNSTGGIC
jgi:hypothetical protein